MSTRSVIGTAHDGGFVGRYCHWDGYPTAKGPQLQETYRQLRGDVEAVKTYAIRPEVPGYWSSYAPPAEAALEEAKPRTTACWLCNGTGARTDGVVREGWCNGCDGTGTSENRDRTTTWVSGDDELLTDRDDAGTEWAYLLDERGITVAASTYADGTKAIGMFGTLGTDDVRWVHAGFVAWDDDDADWEAIEDYDPEEPSEEPIVFCECGKPLGHD